jgi:hypothetical protein
MHCEGYSCEMIALPGSLPAWDLSLHRYIQGEGRLVKDYNQGGSKTLPRYPSGMGFQRMP